MSIKNNTYCTRRRSVPTVVRRLVLPVAFGLLDVACGHLVPGFYLILLCLKVSCVRVAITVTFHLEDVKDTKERTLL